ncbi:hypothetical protein BSR29_03320 [Boudabousia liubingyangii]|uniref:DedA family protein n=2 Tax=Boudabousia liubingyangii TaxID=1921764 RepID=A0A1Q5PNL6_9ACTO|nr:hypothetical protein BSR28_02895 [Boudabousia liubingyangii]OKL49168.1 hypothetical protein BSR29_03320 [Boudabousia liubingyangii]
MILALTVIVFFRAQGTYWLGRLITGSAEHDFKNPLLQAFTHNRFFVAMSRWFNGPTPQKGAQALEKWGLIIIPLCFLTVGVQTAVNAGAGLLRMNWGKYTIAMLPGCLAWGTLYGLGFLALWISLLGTIAGSLWALLALIGLIVLIALYVMLQRRRRKAFAVDPQL